MIAVDDPGFYRLLLGTWLTRTIKANLFVPSFRCSIPIWRLLWLSEWSCVSLIDSKKTRWAREVYEMGWLVPSMSFTTYTTWQGWTAKPFVPVSVTKHCYSLCCEVVPVLCFFFEVFTDKIISEQCFILSILSYYSLIMNGIQGYAMPDRVPGSSCHMATEWRFKFSPTVLKVILGQNNLVINAELHASFHYNHLLFYF